jgi:hypothetical protein
MVEAAKIKNKRWKEVIGPELERCFNTKRGRCRFKAVGLFDWLEEPLAKDTWDAVLKEAQKVCAFTNDYGDHCVSMQLPNTDEVVRNWDKAVIKVIWNIIKYDDPYYDPVDKAFSAFIKRLFI